MEVCSLTTIQNWDMISAILKKLSKGTLNAKQGRRLMASFFKLLPGHPVEKDKQKIKRCRHKVEIINDTRTQPNPGMVAQYVRIRSLARSFHFIQRTF